ncbi:TonB-dependent receptor [Massilia sp. B-10]|nr:TonB-dependent receptor [Massilia sp. B-10]
MQDDLALADQWLLGLGALRPLPLYWHGRPPVRRLRRVAQRQPDLLAQCAADRAPRPRALRGVGVMEPFLKSFQTNDPALQAEKARNTDLGVQWQSGPWQANAALFNQQIDNYIGYDDARQNLGQVRTRGYSASAMLSRRAVVGQRRPVARQAAPGRPAFVKRGRVPARECIGPHLGRAVRPRVPAAEPETGLDRARHRASRLRA